MGPRVLTWDVGQLHEPCLLLVLPAERRVQGPAPREVLGHTAGGGVPKPRGECGGTCPLVLSSLSCFNAPTQRPHSRSPTPLRVWR